ncbi:MAG: SapC family protein [Gammaproteobacteria bacterium]|nr:SapC family protein [Pseudomonadales bacterium]
MSSPVPLASDKHTGLKVTESGDYRRYKDQNLIPIIVKDFFTLAAEFPLVFVTGQKAGEFVPVAVMGLKQGQNLYCQTERWKAQVVPISFHNAPFSIARVDPQGDQFVVLIDEESPMLSKTEGEWIFTEEGEKTEYMNRRIDAMMDVTRLTLQTQKVCQLLNNKNLLISHQVQLQHRPDGNRYQIDGIYIINEEALNKLPNEDFLSLRRQGLLPIIYSHLTSLQQLRRISEMQYEADQITGKAEAQW